MTHAIEANLVNIINVSDDLEALKSLGAAPVGLRLTGACLWLRRLLLIRGFLIRYFAA